MRNFTMFLAVLAITACSNSGDSYHIYGTVENPDLEGARIFLVPMNEPVIQPSKENLDSTWIVDGKFEFHGRVERLGDLRIERRRRNRAQNLLVVTEPGTITVTIGTPSHGGGTPQNDSLQVWKDLAFNFRRERKAAATEDQKDSLRRAFRARTLELAHNCGDSTTTVGRFLLERI